MNTSRIIVLDGTQNLRDLGGMFTIEGKTVRENVLFRSDKLSRLSENDVEKLISLHLSCAYDLRGTREQMHEPDVAIPGCEHISLPVFPEKAEGVAYENDAIEKGYIGFVEAMLRNKDSSRLKMIADYRSFISSEYSRKQFRFLLEDLLQREKEARHNGVKRSYLYHCAGGKDRTGFVSIVLQEIFGIAREDIIEDYMLTNQFLRPNLGDASPKIAEMMKEHFGDRLEEVSKQIQESVGYMIQAKREYIEAVYDEIDQRYGSFSTYLTEGLLFPNDKQDGLKELFLI